MANPKLTTPEYLTRVVIPAALQLLPAPMASPAATAMLVAIALQESRATHRAQVGGPAHSFWQFEIGGVAGLLTHPATAEVLGSVLDTLQYPHDAASIYVAIQHQDILAAVLARLLLWTDPAPLPTQQNADEAWSLYQRCWRPGRPRHSTWDLLYASAWRGLSPS